MKDFWKYWALFTAMVIMPLNGYLFGTEKADIVIFLILCLMQFPLIIRHILGE